MGRARPCGRDALLRVRYASAGGTRTAMREGRAPARPLRVCGLDEHGHAGAWPSRLAASATRLRVERVRPCGRDALLRVRYASAGWTSTATQERGPPASPRPLRVCGRDAHGHAGGTRSCASATRLRVGRARPRGRDALLRVRYASAGWTRSTMREGRAPARPRPLGTPDRLVGVHLSGS